MLFGHWSPPHACSSVWLETVFSANLTGLNCAFFTESCDIYYISLTLTAPSKLYNVRNCIACVYCIYVVFVLCLTEGHMVE